MNAAVNAKDKVKVVIAIDENKKINDKYRKYLESGGSLNIEGRNNFKDIHAGYGYINGEKKLIIEFTTDRNFADYLNTKRSSGLEILDQPIRPEHIRQFNITELKIDEETKSAQDIACQWMSVLRKLMFSIHKAESKISECSTNLRWAKHDLNIFGVKKTEEGALSKLNGGLKSGLTTLGGGCLTAGVGFAGLGISAKAAGNKYRATKEVNRLMKEKEFSGKTYELALSKNKAFKKVETAKITKDKNDKIGVIDKDRQAFVKSETQATGPAGQNNKGLERTLGAQYDKDQDVPTKLQDINDKYTAAEKSILDEYNVEEARIAGNEEVEFRQREFDLAEYQHQHGYQNARDELSAQKLEAAGVAINTTTSSFNAMSGGGSTLAGVRDTYDGDMANAASKRLDIAAESAGDGANKGDEFKNSMQKWREAAQAVYKETGDLTNEVLRHVNQHGGV